MGAASELLHRRPTAARQSRTRSTSSSTSTPATTPEPPEEPDGAQRAALQSVNTLVQQGLDLELAAQAVGVSPSTVSRWRARSVRGEPLARRPGPQRRIPSREAQSAVEREVRDTRGLVGAAALARTTGTSRRVAATIKADVLTAMERERVAALQRIVITQPGVVRGFDQKWMPTTQGLRRRSFAAMRPFRIALTLCWQSGTTRSRCSRSSKRTSATNGPPVVLRLDRASVHRTPPESADSFAELRSHRRPSEM
jgi:hypothetical protein